MPQIPQYDTESPDQQSFEITLPGNITLRTRAGSNDELGRKVNQWMFQKDDSGNFLRFDPSLGASFNVRMAVGNAPSPEDRLATVQKYYPGAMPMPDGNFIIFDQRVRKFAYYNPEGLDWGDVGSMGRDVASMTGAIGGGALGSLGGPVVAGVGAGVGGEAVGQAYDQMLRSVLGTEDTRSTGERLAEAAVSVGTIGAGEGLGRAVPLALKAALGPSDKATSRSMVEAYNTVGVPARMAGDITGNRTVQGLQAVLSRLPGGANVINTAVKKTLRSIGDVKTQETAALYPGSMATKQEAGEVVQQGANDFISRWRSAADVAYNRVSAYNQMPVTPVNTARITGDIQARLGGEFPTFAKSETPGIFSNIQNDVIFNNQYGTGFNSKTLGGMKELRTRIGARLADPQFFADARRGELKQLYSAVTQDMRDALQRQSPDALARFDNATRIWERGLNYAEETYKPILKEGFGPEKAYEWATGQIGSGNTRLGNVVRGFTNDQKDMVLGTILNRLGTNADGEFDLAQFAREWGKVTPEARNLIFGRGKQALGLVYDRIAEIAQGSRQTMRMANTSGTATSLPFLALLGLGGGGGMAAGGVEGAITGVKMAAFGTMSSYAVAKLMTSPRFVNWLVQPVTPNGIPAHIGRLAGIVASDPSLSDSVQQFVHSQFEQETQQ